MKNWVQNSLLVFGSFALTLFITEYVILQFFIPTTDVARVEFKEELIRYKHNQRGVTKLSNEFSAEFSINQQGWNSHHKLYSINKNNKTRIAIIGDSYIAGLEPGYKNAIPYLLEQKLGPNKHEVYNFGIGGAHLSQYLHMFNKEVLKYNPSLIIFLVIHNDFTPSYSSDLTASGRYGGTFLTLRISGNGNIVENNPKPYNPKWDKLLDFRLIRFIFYQHKLRTRISYIKNLVLNEQYEMNMKPSSFNDTLNRDRVLAKYVVSKIINSAKKRGIKILFVMNGDTQSIYKRTKPDKDSKPIKLNKMMRKIAENNDAHFLDLQEIFYNDFKVNNKKFEFKTDGHWSPYGHSIASEALIKKTTEILNITE